MKFKQINFEQHDSSIKIPIASTRYSYKYFEKSLPVKFSDYFDNFDYSKTALFELENLKQFALVYYKRAPVKETLILSSEDSEDINIDIANIIDALQLSDSDLTWKITDEIGKSFK